MKAFLAKYSKYVPGTVILLIHLLFVILVSTGDFSGPRIAAGKFFVHAVAVALMLSTALYGYVYPQDGPDIKGGGVNAPTTAGLVFIIAASVLAWVLFYWGGTYAY